MIKVSVIVPVYNMECALEKCLDSLLAQTLEEIEIIAVDDGSTDSSPDILKRYSEKSPKIRAVRKENGGLSDARNYGLRFASGEYIGYVDSDDFVDPDMYETMYNKAKETGSEIVECNLHHTYENYEDTEIMTKYYKPSELLCFGRHVVWNKIYLRSWLVDTKIEFPFGLIYEDVSFFSKLVPYITSYAYVDIAPIHYVQRSGSINNKSTIKTAQIFTILEDILAYYKGNGFYQRFERELEYMYARILLCSSFSRMSRIGNKSDRRRALRENWELLVKTYPQWRKNPILRRQKSSRALYMKTVNSVTYRIYSAVMPAINAVDSVIHRKW